MTGRVARLYIKAGHGQPMIEVPMIMAVAGKGLEGDAAFGRERRQVLLVGESSLEAFGLHPGDVRENVTVSGMVLDDLPAGSRLKVGEALLEVTGDCEPCEQIEALRPGLREAIRGRRGMLARVQLGGPIRLGDPVLMVDRVADG